MPPRNEEAIGGMAGSRPPKLDLPPGMTMDDIEIDPDLDSVMESELGLDVSIQTRLNRIYGD
jgi:hypothetical protein